jgi:nucleoside-diphosphate-sugar epimerase
LTSIAVTGASGFIGRHVVGAFTDAGFAVRGLTRSSASANLMSLNYLDANAAARALEGIEVVVHVAGLAHISSKSLADPLFAFRAANTLVAEQMARASVRAGARKFILLSSAGVLGKQSPPGGFTDTSPAMPYDAYTVSKFEAEQRVLDTANGKISLAILRPPMVYGPGAPGSFGRLCAWIDRGLPLPLGRIAARRSFVGIRNLCSLLLTIATDGKQAPNARLTLLVADSEALTIAEFAQRIAGARRRHAVLLPVPAIWLKWTLCAAGLGEEYRRLALPFELVPSRARESFEWVPPYSTLEELGWALER